MKLKTERGPEWAVMSWNELRQALAGLNDNGNCFAILERPDGSFVQTAVTTGGMEVEKSEGSLDRHFRGERNGSRELSLVDAEAVFRAFYEGSPMPSGIHWVKPEPRVVSKGVWWLLWALPWLAVAWVIYESVGKSAALWEWLQ